MTRMRRIPDQRSKGSKNGKEPILNQKKKKRKGMEDIQTR